MYVLLIVKTNHRLKSENELKKIERLFARREKKQNKKVESHLFYIMIYI